MIKNAWLSLYLCVLMLLLIPHDAFALSAQKSKGLLTIDGIANEKSWTIAQWQPIDKLIIGDQLKPSDFSGRFKLLWDEQQLYLLAEIEDDILFDQFANPLHRYWDDDCLEVFIDEDASGGNHQYNFNAFAYHVALDNQVVDMGEKHVDGSDNFMLLNDHITSAWRRDKKAPNKVIWELSIRIYDDKFSSVKKSTKPVRLSTGKVMGFMLAYCDNDGSETREHFIGSTEIKAVNGDKNLGYITADVFERLLLTE